MTPAHDSASLTVVERAKLANFESVISGGLQSFVDVGRALMEIRDGKLYRIEHKTFEAYCQERWSMTKQHAHRLMNATDAATEIAKSNPGVTPQTERHVRPLANLPKHEQAEVWQEAVDTAPAGKVTAKHVEATVARKLESNGETRRWEQGASSMSAPRDHSAADKESDTLFRLKQLWGKASKRDRKAFISWIKNKE
jgi:hypothetical protein